MNDRSFEDAANEYDELNFHQSVSRFAHAFEGLSRGELMAMGGKFLELAHGLSPVTDDEKQTSACLAEAVEEVIVFRLAGNDAGLQAYLAAKQAHLQHLRDYVAASQAAKKATQHPASPTRDSSSWVGSWFGKRK